MQAQVASPPSAPALPGGITRYGYLLISTLLLLALQGMVPPGSLQQLVVTTLAGATLILAFRASKASPHWVAAVTAIAAIAFAVALFRALGGGVGEGAARAINAGLMALGPPAVAIGVVRDLRLSGRVRMDAVAGVLSLYMLIGMFFAFLYGAVDRFGNHPFFAGDALATVAHCLYFSFTTLTTVGYGDFAARSDVGHTLAVFEALIGQIYLVTVVSLIVSNLGRPAVGRS